MTTEQIGEHLDNKDLALSWERTQKGSACEFRAAYGGGIIMVDISPNLSLTAQNTVNIHVRFQFTGTEGRLGASSGAVSSFDDHTKQIIENGIRIAKEWADSNPVSPEDREKAAKLVCEEVGKYLAP